MPYAGLFPAPLHPSEQKTSSPAPFNAQEAATYVPQRAQRTRVSARAAGGGSGRARP